MMQQYEHKFLLQRYKYAIHINGSFQKESAEYLVLTWYGTTESLVHTVGNGKYP